MNSSRFLGMIVFLTIFSIISIYPQNGQTGKIKGKILDKNGKAVPFVNVMIDHTNMGAASDVKGNYEISNVPSGTHQVSASAIGYRTDTATVTVAQGETSTQNFSLEQDVLGMHEVVVTGTALPIQKLNATNSISTISPRELAMAQPQSTTGFLKYVPGFTRVESSGGYVNENYTMRGIYSTIYINFMEDGLPCFPTQNIFFMNTDNLFRIDENVKRVEVVRGGSAGLFGSNTPAAVINLISKTGGPSLGGEAQVEVGTQGLGRVDYNMNGPIGENWRFNLGGFYLYDHGIRNPGYDGNRGGELQGNLTRLFSNGYIRVYGKYINAKSQFILDLPHNNPSNPTQFVPGFGTYGSFNSPEGLDISVPTPDGSLTLPLGNGLSTNAGWLTGELYLQFPDGWSFKNQLQVMNNQQEWNAIIPGNAEPIGAFENSELSNLQSRGFIPVNASNVGWNLSYTNVMDANGNHLAFPNSAFTPSNNLIAPGNEWHVAKPMSAFQEQFQINKSLDFGGDFLYHHNLSLIAYFANYSMENHWYFPTVLTDVQDITHFVDAAVTYTDPASGKTKTLNVTKNGFTNYMSNYVNGAGQGTILDGVLSDQMMVTKRLRLNIAGRWESDGFVQTTENTSSVQPNGTAVDSTTPPYAIENWGNGSYRHMSTTLHDWAFTAGLNYDIIPNIWTFFANFSRGYEMPSLDNLLNDQAAQVAIFQDARTLQYEAGFKYFSDLYSFNADVFWADLKNITSQGAVNTPSGGVEWVTNYSPEQRAYGIEADATYTPLTGLYFRGNWTLLKSVFGSGAGPDIGSLLNGIPSSIGDLGGRYTLDNWTLGADWHYVGNRLGGTLVSQFTSAGVPVIVAGTALPAYNYMNMSLAYYIPSQAVTLTLGVTNLYQDKGLEEGNPRASAVGSYFLARPILPRRLTFTAKYSF
jgi:iron complex outermembrane recepter protein